MFRSPSTLFRFGLRTGTNKPTARPGISERAFYLTVLSPAHVKSQCVFCPCSLAPTAEKEGYVRQLFLLRLCSPLMIHFLASASR